MRRRLIAALVVLIGLVAVGLVLRRARAPQDDRVWQTPSPTVVAVVPASPTPLASPAPPRLEGVVPRSPTPMFPATPPASPAVPSPTPDARARPSAPDWLQTTGREFVDTAGRTVVLRGFVTLTNDSEGQPVVYTLDDYRRMRQLGANYQSIRLGAGALGAWPGAPGAPQYLDRLAGMVAMAKQVGMYSTFKLTVYDLRGFTRGGWEALWADRHGEQAALIAGWRRIWERFRDEPAVVGYDLLNEPEPGDLGVSPETFIADYLNPFYRRVIDDLRRTDARHLAFFQPPFGSPPYRAPLQRPGVVYTPHFYPNLPNYLRRGDFSTSAYAPELQRFLSEASLHQAPLFIGEYGMPWSPRNDGDAPRERQYQQLERTASALFDQHRLGFSRPWFADDRAGVRLGGLDLNWALIRGPPGCGDRSGRSSPTSSLDPIRSGWRARSRLSALTSTAGRSPCGTTATSAWAEPRSMFPSGGTTPPGSRSDTAAAPCSGPIRRRRPGCAWPAARPDRPRARSPGTRRTRCW